jgi:hypothetical protein
MKWLEQHAYLAAWLALPIALVPPLLGKLQGKPINSTKVLLQVAFVFCLAAVFTPVFEDAARMFAAVFAVVLLIFIFILEGAEPKPPTRHSAQSITQTSAQPAKQREKKEKAFITLAPRELTGFYRQGNTSIQAARLAEPYLGKWLKLSGTVSDIRDVFVAGKSLVTLKEFSIRNEEYVLLFFSQEWIEHLSTMRAGDSINAIGKVGSIDSTTVTLQDCEIV